MLVHSLLPVGADPLDNDADVVYFSVRYLR